MHHEPAALDRERKAGAVLGLACPDRNRNGSLILSMWMRPWIGSNLVGDFDDLARLVSRRHRGGSSRISCSGLVFLLGASGDDSDRIVGQWPL